MSDSQTDVLIVEDVRSEAIDRLSQRYRVEFAPDLWSDRPALETRIAVPRALIVRNRTLVDRALLAKATRLEIVGRAGAGLDNVDLAAADNLGIVVTAGGGANAQSVAELAIGLAIALARRIPARDRDVRAGGWDRTPGIELAGRTWGVVGLGRTGFATVRSAVALGMEGLGYDPFVEPNDPRPASIGVGVVGLDELLERSHVVSLHVALDSSTRHLVDARFLGRMRPDALLINVARGEIVDERALADALAADGLGGAALDVRVREPSRAAPFPDSDRLILTPHVAGLTDEAQARIGEILASDVSRVLAGGVAEHAVGRARSGR